MAQLYFYYSAMNAGKSTSLLQSAYNYRERGMHSIIYTAALDDRYGVGKVTSRIGLQADAKLYSKDDDLFTSIRLDCEKRKPDCVFIDEAQFFDPAIVKVCRELANSGKRVVVAGLEKDYLAKGFGSMPELLVDAEYITKVNAICMKCGDPANYSHRISGETKQVVVGETDKYEALCRRCFQEEN